MILKSEFPAEKKHAVSLLYRTIIFLSTQHNKYSNSSNQRTNGPVNAHLISGTTVRTIKALQASMIPRHVKLIQYNCRE